MKKESLFLRFLYRTMAGRAVLRLLVQPRVSKVAGRFLNLGLSRWMVPVYIKKYRIPMDGYEEKEYSSFNDFFTRKRVAGSIDTAPGCLVSPCDGFLRVYPVNKGQRYQIKGIVYSLADLLQDEKAAESFAGGLCMVFRLTPQNYHRYCYVCDGVKQETHKIPGVLHCVRPIACSSGPVFAQNSREYTVIDTEAFGKLVQMEVGALLVGKIHNYQGSDKVFCGMEKGYFEFGGSTVLVLVQKNRLEVTGQILDNSMRGLETAVRMGEKIGVSPSLWGQEADCEESHHLHGKGCIEGERPWL